LASAALVTTANNIGSIALNIANHHGIERIVFAGKAEFLFFKEFI